MNQDINAVSTNTHSDYLHFYSTAPRQEINVQDFLEIAKHRKQLLTKVADLRTTSDFERQQAITKHQKHMAEVRAKDGPKDISMQAIIRQHTELVTAHQKKTIDAVRKLFNQEHGKMNAMIDNIGHYICMLAACGEKTRQDAYIRQEVDLFRLRLLLASPNDISDLVYNANLPMERFQPSPKVQNALQSLSPNHTTVLDLHERQIVDAIRYLSNPSGYSQINNATNVSDEYFQMKFTDAFKYHIDKTKIVIVAGKAYVTRDCLTEILSKEFYARLNQKMERMAQQLEIVLSKHPLLQDVVTQVRNYDLVEGDDQNLDIGQATLRITLQNLPQLARTSFPLCQQRIVKHVNKEHHAQHDARFQLQSFFVSVGLTADESVEWWRNQFAPKYPGDKFDKAYEYNFRHLYGEKGKMQLRTSPGCGYWLNKEPTAAQAHGCPFKHLTGAGSHPERLRPLLTDAFKHLPATTTDEKGNVVPITTDERNAQIDHILELCRGTHYQLACGQLFKFTHGNIALSHNITNPLVYYNQSIAYYSGKNRTADGEQKNKTMNNNDEDDDVVISTKA